MPRRARVHFVSLRSSLVNLPISIYGPLLERSVRPQGLAIHLILVPAEGQRPNDKVEAYVGWTGMASASSLAQFNSAHSGESGLETVEIDPQYAQGLGLTQGDIVEIGLLHDLPLAKSVGTEPLTSDDWEIIELHASHVESTLLSQVRVAKIGQEIDVWVLGRTRVRLRVVSLDPASRSNALLLATNTEVSIAPKLHRNKLPLSSQANGKFAESDKKPVNGVTNGKPKLVKPVSYVLRILPRRLLRDLTFPEHTGSELVAYVSPRTFARIFPFTSRSQDSLCHKATFKRLPSPVDPSASSSSSPTPTPTARVLNPGVGEKEKEKEQSTGTEPGTGDVFIGQMDGITESHLTFLVASEGIEEWDIVHVAEATEHDSIMLQQASADIIPSSSVASSLPPRSFLAGVDDILTKCSEYCTRQFILHSTTNSVHGVSGLLVTGRSGTGKTSIVRAVAKELQDDPSTYCHIHYVDASRHAEQPVLAVKALMNYWFNKAVWHKPTVLVLDNLDKLLSAEVEHADSFRSRHLTEIFVSIFSASSRTASLNSRGIVLIATASSSSALHPLLNSTHIFKEVIHVKPPNKDARRDILSRIMKDRLDIATDISQDLDDPLNFTALATQTEGYSAMDLQDLVARAVHQVAIRVASGADKAVIKYEDFNAAQKDFIPLSLRDVKLQKSDVAWSDIGGLRETRRILRETLEWPTKYAPIFAQSPLRLRSGLLLYGFPGCGKTLLASAVAKECGLNFISVKGPEILNKYIGASEKSVRDLFERASAAKPCILFFDEFDSIAPKRGHDSTGVTDRVVNQMLTQMDGAEGLDGVYVLAATSRPDLIDSALLRPGRLDKSLLCNMPDQEERKDILQAVARKVAVSPSVDFDSIASATEGYSGADLQALIYNAHLEVIHASIAAADHEPNQLDSQEDEEPVKFTTLGGSSSRKMLSKAEQTAIEQRLRQIHISSRSPETKSNELQSAHRKRHDIEPHHIQKVLRTTRPSVPLEERERLGRIYRGFVSDRNGELPVPPDAGGIGNRVSLM
ncbi:P-loop containing nucleoside triphosphate hydrolase protein [Crucibulum laeve]|uniref:Peroxisomal ATPase PEX1 n=1 Tax=Crucibulum laeve TaxID=68775 RepID=A0A5C3MJ88_9AGAR|nr:P-loop containing nucleoside triphosphate hydrolase protein [Crucibulum laeve]